MTYWYLIAALCFNAGANILLKIGAVNTKDVGLWQQVTNPFIILGLTIFACNVYFYTQALRNLPVSFVYPMQTAVGFLIINAFGIWILKEHFSVMSLAGYAAVLVGIALISLGYR